MFGFGTRRAEDRKVRQIIDMAQSLQIELLKLVDGRLQPVLGPERSAKIAAGIANYIFHFGMVNAEHANNVEVMAGINLELKELPKSFGPAFGQNLLGMLMLLAAVRETNIDVFKKHMKQLADWKYFKIGSETPNVSRDMPTEAGTLYMYEMARMS